ncbi:MAG: response regulator transcription factor [Clostridiales bacterium]|nr:response regulator transcription factor [Clostridiales bacterium]
MLNLLIADDEKEIIRLLKVYLDANEYNVLEANDGAQALAVLNSAPVDIAVVDIMMPKVDGYQLIKKIRERKDKYIPVIIISAKVGLSDRIFGMDIGADDYVTKPFEPLEVVAKINAQKRRLGMTSPVSASDVITVGDVTLDLAECSVKKGGAVTPLTKAELKVLELMMRQPKRVFTKEQIYETGWYDQETVDDNTIRVIISRLRDKVGAEHIKTIRGLGYRYEE